MKRRLTLQTLLLLGVFLLPLNLLFAQNTITIDHTTQRYIGTVSRIDRDKYTNAHILETGNNTELETFKNDYNISKEYIGSRQFWNPLGKVKNGSIPSVKNLYTGERGVVETLVATGTTSSLLWDTTKDYSIEEVREASVAAANYVANCYKKEWNLVPQYIEPFNEPMVHANEYYPKGRDEGKYIGDKTDKVITKICEYHADLGKAIHQQPELKNMKVMGYASAYPEFEKNNFDLWKNRYKKFIDIAGEEVDVFSVHLYDGSGINNSGGRRSGANSEAILDLIETYSFIKLNKVKPIAITEYGRLVPNQDGWQSGNGVSNYESIENSQAVRSQLHFFMSFLERENILETTIPFNVNTRNPASQYSKSSIWIKQEDGSIQNSNRIYFYEMIKEIKGERVRIHTNNIDIQAQAFVEDNELYVLLNNLNDNAQKVNLNLLETGDLDFVETKRLQIFLDKEPELLKVNTSKLPEQITLAYGETVVLKCQFKTPIVFQNTLHSQKYYSSTYLQTIQANKKSSFSFQDIETGEGESTLRLSVAREHGRSLKPNIWVNQKEIIYSGDIIKGYNQSTRSQFFGTLEVPIPMTFLQEGENNVEISFAEQGGQISSVVLQVQKADKALNEIPTAVSTTPVEKETTLLPNRLSTGETVFIDTDHPNISWKVFNNHGKNVEQGIENKINTIGLQPGIYFVLSKTETQLYRNKLIIQ